MLKHPIGLAALAAGLAVAAQASAQQPADAGPAFRPVVMIYEWGTRLPDGVVEPMRRAGALGDIRDWIESDDPEVALLESEEGLDAVATLRFDIGPDGRATGCALKRTEGDPRLTEHLCERLSPRVEMRPAIDDMGRPLPDIAEISVAYRQWRTRARPVVQQPAQPAPPILAPPTRVDREDRLVLRQPPYPLLPAPGPPPRRLGRDFTAPNLRLLPGGASSRHATARPWAQVDYADVGQGICSVRASSGDQAFNAQACAAARAGGITGEAAIHFVKVNGKPLALLPVQDPSRPQIAPDSLAAIRQQMLTQGDWMMGPLKLAAVVGPDGALVRCAIVTTSGYDAIDARGCAVARRLGRFSPGRDAFGRAVEGYVWFELREPPTAD